MQSINIPDIKESNRMFFVQILKVFFSWTAFCIFCAVPILAIAGIVNTKHNLSVSVPGQVRPGQVRALSETQICKFCHTPHNADPAYPLWNHELSSATYENYWSNTLKSYGSRAEAPPIDGFSKLCLSCHDGTVAIGAIVSDERIQMVTVGNVVEAGRLSPGAAGYLGTNLKGGHPISIIYDGTLVSRRNSETGLNHLKWPVTDPDVKLYPTQGGYGVQCTSCHDPHGGKGGPTAPPFWRKIDENSVCTVCHEEIDIDFPGFKQ